MKSIAAVIALALLLSTRAEASELKGPGRFCGYSPIIDLLSGEKITTLEGGIHGGKFRWEGSFGVLEVYGIGWASRPTGTLIEVRKGRRPARFAERSVKDRYEVAIWNGAHGAAYISSATPFSRDQLKAVRRVRLFEEGQIPSGCDLRTVFSWE
ncbi:MAG TPA: hypothetical protein PLO65_07160 [Caulobacter sp.]|nr:hypothetical protein [Caulobacter sp.]